MSQSSHYKAEAADKPIPTCPSCGKSARETKTRYGLRNSCCDLWSWDRHPLVSAETHAARNEAHKAFDRLWKDKILPRGNAYKALADELGMSRADCHIKLMDAQTASKVPAAALRIAEGAQNA
jgi:hypothetical protein